MLHTVSQGRPLDRGQRPVVDQHRDEDVPQCQVGRYFAQNLQVYSSSSLKYFPAGTEIRISWNTPSSQVASGAYPLVCGRMTPGMWQF